MKFAKAAVTAALTITLALAAPAAGATQTIDTALEEQASPESTVTLEDQVWPELEVPLVAASSGQPQEVLDSAVLDTPLLEDPALANMPEDGVEAEENTQTHSRLVAEASAGEFGTQLLSILNAERAKIGLSPLKLTIAAQEFAQTFTQTWTDLYATCGTPSLAGCHMDWVLGQGSSAYRTAELKAQGWGNGGDPLARGYQDEAALANAWLASPDHRKWIMDGYGPMSAVGLGKVTLSKTSGYVTTTTNHWTLWIVGSPRTNPSPDLSEVGETTRPITPAPTPQPPSEPAFSGAMVERLSGTCRYSTNLTLNQKHMQPGKPVFVATGAQFPDALSIGPAVSQQDGTLFLAQQGHITAGALDLIAKNKPSAVYIVGGSGAISDSVASQVAMASGKGPAGYQRLAGTDRYSTSVKIFDTFFSGSSPTTVFIATGSNFPDALSAAAAGGAVNSPVLLVNGSGAPSLNASQAASLAKSKTKSIQIVGGGGVVNGALEADIRARGYSVARLFGSNRYDTNAAVNRYVSNKVGSAVSSLWVATGSNFPDALSAAAPAGTYDARLVLSPGTCLPKASISGTLGSALEKVHLVGGAGALAPSVESMKQC